VDGSRQAQLAVSAADGEPSPGLQAPTSPRLCGGSGWPRLNHSTTIPLRGCWRRQRRAPMPGAATLPMPPAPPSLILCRSFLLVFLLLTCCLRPIARATATHM
jgi:hypothetical protein